MAVLTHGLSKQAKDLRKYSSHLRKKHTIASKKFDEKMMAFS